MKDPNMGRCSWIIQVGSVSSKILIRGKQRVIRRDVKTEAEGREQDLKICYEFWGWKKDEEMDPKQKQHPVVDVTGDRSKVWCCKEQYCTGTWNIRSMNQGKLEVIKQEMARVKVNILGISELKCTGMGEFNSDNHYIYYYGQESLRRNGVAIIVNKRVRNAVLRGNLKNDRMISVLSKATIQHHSNATLSPNH